MGRKKKYETSWYGSAGNVKYYVYKNLKNRIKIQKKGFKSRTSAEEYRKSLYKKKR